MTYYCLNLTYLNLYFLRIGYLVYENLGFVTVRNHRVLRILYSILKDLSHLMLITTGF